MQSTQGERFKMPSNNKNRSYAIALSGILSAICIVLMFCTGFIPIGAYILPAVAGLVVWIIYREISRKWALLCYAAVALLALLLTPDIESKLLFSGFFGYYPVIRDLLTKVKPAVLSFLLRFLCCNIRPASERAWYGTAHRGLCRVRTVCGTCFLAYRKLYVHLLRFLFEPAVVCL